MVENFFISFATVSFPKMAVLHNVNMKIMDRMVTITKLTELINSNNGFASFTSAWRLTL